jgi:hypothetical protein
MYIHKCVNTLSPAQPSPYIILRLYICSSIQQESHRLAVAVICCYGERSIPSLCETKRRKRNSYHPRAHQISLKKAIINIYTYCTYIYTYNICLLMYIHMCVNTLSPAQPSPYISPRLFICAFDKQESHHLAVTVLSRYDNRSGTTLSETKRRKRNSYHPRSQ